MDAVNIFSAENLEGRVDVARAVGTTSTAMFIYDLAPGQSSSPYHYEYEDEWLLVVDGTIAVRAPDGERTLERGDLVRFPSGPAGAHKAMNRSESPARMLMFSSARSPAVSVYPDSDKIGRSAARSRRADLRARYGGPVVAREDGWDKALEGARRTATSTSAWPRDTTSPMRRCSSRRPSTRSSTSSSRSPEQAARSSSGSAPAGSRCRSPLRGVPVHGIELSKAMVARLRAKPGGEDDRRRRSATSRRRRSTGRSRVAYLVFNTIMNLTTQAAQVACFRNVAAHLEPGGCFVIEVEVPEPPAAAARRDDPRLPRERDAAGGSTSTTSRIRASSRTTSRSSTAGLERLSVPFRYAWPSELDLMAQLAGMSAARALERLEARAVHERAAASTSRCGRSRRDAEPTHRHDTR